MSKAGSGAISLAGLPENGSTVYVIGAGVARSVSSGQTNVTITGIASGTYLIGVKNAGTKCGSTPVSFTVE